MPRRIRHAVSERPAASLWHLSVTGLLPVIRYGLCRGDSVTDTEFERTSATPTSNTVCQTYTSCQPLEYETRPASRTHDRLCSLLTVCEETEEVVTEPTLTTDRVCGPKTPVVAAPASASEDTLAAGGIAGVAVAGVVVLIVLVLLLICLLTPSRVAGYRVDPACANTKQFWVDEEAMVEMAPPSMKVPPHAHPRPAEAAGDHKHAEVHLAMDSYNLAGRYPPQRAQAAWTTLKHSDAKPHSPEHRCGEQKSAEPKGAGLAYLEHAKPAAARQGVA